VLLHLLPQAGEAESKFVTVLTRLESQAISLQLKICNVYLRTWSLPI
jgi:hypothetical protein